MKVTNINITPFKDAPEAGSVKGLADIELDGALSLRGLKILKDDNGELHVGYPIDPFYKGVEYRSSFLPTDKALKAHIEKAVLAQYRKEACTPHTVTLTIEGHSVKVTGYGSNDVEIMQDALGRVTATID